MNYYELTFTYTSPVATSIINDVLAAELGEIGFESFAENENGLQGWGGLLVFGRLFITQIYIPMNDNVFYIRQKLGDNWGKWAKYEGVLSLIHILPITEVSRSGYRAVFGYHRYRNQSHSYY